ncbi:hypothetical protein [Enterococcus sp. AZ163]|uniref:hypothetical protein n=1 Tax=Enterococcus sp. AZ163 TaxID=2774638 RepID=UPI003D2C3F19
MSDKKIYIISKGIGALFFCLFFSNMLAPEFVSRYRPVVILFFIFLVGGFMYYRYLQRNLKKELASEGKKFKMRQEKLQNDLTETIKELATIQSEILDHRQKVDDRAKKDHDIR